MQHSLVFPYLIILQFIDIDTLQLEFHLNSYSSKKEKKNRLKLLVHTCSSRDLNLLF